MLRIKEMNVKNKLGNIVDYILKNGIELYNMDWNGEIYTNGYDRTNEKDTNYNYKPVYEEKEDGEMEIIGFEEK